MTIRRFADYPYPNSIEDINSVADYLKKLHSSLQDESTERIMDFDILRLTNVPWVDVRKYGAKGDGVTDDSKAIQAAIDSLTNGGIVFFPKGDYLISALLDITYDNTILMGMGGKLSKIFMTAPNASVSAMIRAQSSTATKRNGIHITGLYFYGNASSRIWTYTGGINFSNVEDSSITGCFFEKLSAVAIFFGRYSGDNDKNSSNIIIKNNTIKDCYSDGIYGQVFRYCRISDNYVEGSGTDGDNYPLLFEGIYESIVTNNVAYNNSQGIIINNSGTVKQSRSVVANNVVRKSGVYGIFIAKTYGVTISGNAIYETGSTSNHVGIMIHDPYNSTYGHGYGAFPRNIIIGNIVESSGGAGIGCSINGNLIIGNYLTNNNTSNTANLAGIDLFNNSGGGTSPNFNIIIGNVIYNVMLNEEAEPNGNQKYGVSLSSGSTNNTVINNTMLNMVTGDINDLGTGNYIRSKNISEGTAAPTSGTYDRGDIVWNTSPSASGKIGWVCITAGSPGTWKAFGAIDA